MAPPSPQGPLPVELHELILEEIRSDLGTLLALQGANKAFRALYAQAAFYKVHIDGSVHGALKLGTMLRLDIVQHVKHLEFRTLADDMEEYTYEKVDEQTVAAFNLVAPFLSTLQQVTSATIILNEFGTCIERQSPSIFQSLRSVQSLNLSVTRYMGEEHGEIINHKPIWASGRLFCCMPISNLSPFTPLGLLWAAPHSALASSTSNRSPSKALCSAMRRCSWQTTTPSWASPQEFIRMHRSTLKSLKLMNCAVLARVLEVGYRSPIPTAAKAWKCLSEDMYYLKEIEVAFDAERRSWDGREKMGRWKGYYTGTNKRAGNIQGALPSKDQIPNLEDDDRELANFITRVREGIPPRPNYSTDAQARGAERLLAEFNEYHYAANTGARLCGVVGT
ncbi:hypothetical protein BDZ89DRAFT_1072755 [Hymenopellis radicata]|nr:hypothetical protein BDZ89DRAFT_1072755 [Hymenopellis radicata]